MIKRGCTLATVVLLALFGAYLWLLWGRFETLPVVILAGFGALGVVMLVTQVRAVLVGNADVGPLKRAEQGLPLEDGREEAVWGPIEPLGAPLEAPFSGTPCVAYEYDAKSATADVSEDGETSAASTLVGFALAPSVIRSNRGDVRLLGFSLLSRFKAKVVDDPEAKERAVRYAGSTEFTEIGLAKFGAMLSLLSDAMTDDDGSVRKDMRKSGATAAELEGCRFEEKIVAPGDTVTAIGLWDAAKGGLVPKVRGERGVVRLLPGGGAAMVAHAQKRPWGTFAFAIVWAGFVHAVIVLVLMKFPR